MNIDDIIITNNLKFYKVLLVENSVIHCKSITSDKKIDIKRKDIMKTVPFKSQLWTEVQKNEPLLFSKKKMFQLEKIITQVSMAEELTNTWNLKNMDKNLVIFHGPPGTGKTYTANKLAAKLGKEILKVDYSTLLSKYHGETGKNIQKIFEEAMENDMVILLDEVDTVLKDRNKMDHIGQQQNNILMQAIDSYKGLIILTTNMQDILDEALISRSFENMLFDLPNEAERLALWKCYLPKKIKVRLNLLASGSDGKSIRDIMFSINRTVVEKVTVERLSGKIASFTEEDFIKNLN
jgi:SpoVK/Ycf46/Vps4 family AAA+-type ATPase